MHVGAVAGQLKNHWSLGCSGWFALPVAPPMNLFPLTVTPFEEYMLADDRPAYPATAVMELDLAGAVDPERLQAALPLALERHPLLNSVVEAGGLRRPRWRPADNPPSFDVDRLDVPLNAIDGDCLPLDRQAGTRIWLRASDNRGRLTLQVHHACSDAIGKLTFLTDWLAIAAAPDLPAAARRLTPPQFDWLRRRDRLRPRLASRKLPPTASSGGSWRRISQFLRRSCAPIATEPSPMAWPPPWPGFQTAELPADELFRLREAARQQDVTFNDWLLAGLFVSLADWAGQDSADDPERLLRVLVPYNTRAVEELRAPAANGIGFRILSQTQRATGDWETMCQDLSAEMERVRCERTSDFMRMIHWLARLRLLTPIVRRWSGCSATAVLSNLGDLSRLFERELPTVDGEWAFGDLRVTGMRAAPPTREGTRLCVVVFTYAGRLHFVTRCDGRGLTADESQTILQRYVARLQNLASPPVTEANVAAGEKAQIAQVGRS